jgi:hypothetical protein
MLAFDGTFNTVYERLVGGAIPIPVDAGVHVLWMRSRDAVNDWGTPFGIVVNMDTAIQGTVGVNEVAVSNGVQLLPNPTDASLGFTVRAVDAGAIERVEVYDGQGRLVRAIAVAGAAQVQVPMVGMATGTYPVRIHTANGIRHDRIVLQ